MNFDYKKMLKPEVNVGLRERKLRYAVGIAAILVSVFLANIPLLLIGSILVATAKFRRCPIYAGLGKSTVLPGEEHVEPDAPAGHH